MPPLFRWNCNRLERVKSAALPNRLTPPPPHPRSSPAAVCSWWVQLWWLWSTITTNKLLCLFSEETTHSRNKWQQVSSSFTVKPVLPETWQVKHTYNSMKHTHAFCSRRKEVHVWQSAVLQEEKASFFPLLRWLNCWQWDIKALKQSQEEPNVGHLSSKESWILELTTVIAALLCICCNKWWASHTDFWIYLDYPSLTWQLHFCLISAHWCERYDHVLAIKDANQRRGKKSVSFS